MARKIPVLRWEYAEEGEDVRRILTESLRLYIVRFLEDPSDKERDEAIKTLEADI
ncbi:MAG: hypothetical protein ACLU62_06960 [Hydrogeniiclostridium sp.]